MSGEVTVRESILRFVAQYPGAHTREIERQLKLSNKLADYHLDALEAEGRVSRFLDRGYVRYFDPELAKAMRAPERRLLFLARRPPALCIMVTLLASGEVSQGELTKAVGLAKASTTYYLNALREAGILLARDEGRHRYYRLRDPAAMRAFLATFHPMPGDMDAFAGVWRDLFGRR